MKTMSAALWLCLLTPLAVAQQPTAMPAASPRPTYPLLMSTSAPAVAELIAKAEAAVKASVALSVSERLLVSWGPYEAHVVYRAAPTTTYFANDDYAEFYVILDGEGTTTVGATLIDPKRTGHRQEATAAEGGTPYKLSKGAMLLVPPGVSHRVTEVNGKYVYMTMKLPVTLTR